MLASVAALSFGLPNLAAAKERGNGRGNSHAARAEQPERGNGRARTNHARHNRTTTTERAGNRHNGAACAPGLAKRTPACVPPGQARRTLREGQRVPTNYGALTSYDEIPLQVRQQYNIPDGFNYIVRDNSVTVVDPRTRLVRSVLNLVRR
jgi:hypothetical protein